jgi:hypothetical protein
MIAHNELRQALLDDLAPFPGRSVWIRHLAAVIDMGRLSDALRPEVMRKIEQELESHPLLADPEFAELSPRGAFLVSCRSNDSLQHFRLLRNFHAAGSDIVSAWIASVLPPTQMAEHLRRSAFAHDAKQRYLLRYYDPLITPVLHRLAPPEWTRWFFGPMIAWWYAVDTPEGESWARLEGGAQPSRTEPVPLMLTEELWEGLANDPFPYRLLNFIEQKYPTLLKDECYGIRLARIEDLLEAGRQHGLSAPNDQIAYVLALLEKPERANDPRWQTTLQMAAAGTTSLDRYFAS